MTTTVAPPAADGPDRPGRPGRPTGRERRAGREWQAGPIRFPDCAGHSPRDGSLDESARRLSHEELAVAETLRDEGHRVRALAAGRGGPTADLSVCGSAVEVKSWESLEARAGRPPTARSVHNKLVAGSEQASHVVLYGRGRALTRPAATRGMAEFAGTPRAARLGSVRVIGDGFDLAWRRDRVAERPPPRPGLDRPTPGWDRSAGR